ncbi:cytochrome P450 76T24-like [Nymphaea colorata]|nr:cytochrome P450 76T24-like [Nymphaea colorata]
MANPLELFLWFVTFLACVYSFRLFSVKSSKLPPGPVGLPILGSLFQIGTKLNESLAELAKVYGPLMTLRLGFKTTVVVSSAEMAAEVLQKHDQAFAGRSVMDAASPFDHSKWALGLGQNGPRWREMRRICNSELLTPRRLDSLRGLREQKVQELLRHVREACQGGQAVNVGECSMTTALNSISNTLFSQDTMGLGSDSVTEFRALSLDLAIALGSPNISDFFPLLKYIDPQGIRRRAEVCIKRFYELLDEIIEKRNTLYSTSKVGKKGDFLDVLLELSTKPGSEFKKECVKPLLLEMFLAATDTSSSTIEWAMAELLLNPKKMEILRLELKQIIGEDRVVQETDIQQLPYLQAVVKETLRLHPPIPLLVPHRADATTKVGGFTIPKHTEVLVNAWAIGRDSAYWENPTAFLPERFLESDVNFKGKDFHFIPFGSGRRMCPGIPLAVRTVYLALAALIHSFEWKLPEGMSPEKLDVEEYFGLTMRKAVPLLAVATPIAT